MGVLGEPLQFIRELALPAKFAVCELGDQFVTEGGQHYPASKFYKGLGCGRYECIDANGRGSLTHDLNQKLDPRMHSKFDLVTDFGTGEHIFNQAQVWRTLHELCKTGGFIVFDRPTYNYDGHCFYLVQWNLISALAHANYYQVMRLEEFEMPRGILLRGVLRKRVDDKFHTPQQGRYVEDLVIDHKSIRRGPDYKSKELRAAGVIINRKKLKMQAKDGHE